MASKENIGGFYYSLGIDTDRGSFARAGEAIKGLTNTVKVAAAAIGAGFAIKATIDKAVKDVNLAEKLGISTYELEKMRLASEMVGVNFGTIANEMDSLNKKFKEAELGKGFDENSARAMQQLKELSGMAVGWEDLKDLTPVERLERLLKAAQSMGDQVKARSLLGDIMGSGTADLLVAMEARNTTWETLLKQAERHTFDNTEAKKSIDELHQELTKLKGTAEGIWDRIFGKVSENWLVPGMKKVNTYLAEHKDEIGEGIDKAFGGINKAWDKAVKWIDDHPVDWDKVIGTTFDVFTTGLGIVLDHAEKIAGHVAEIFKVLAGLGSAIFNGALGAYNWAKEGIESGIKSIADWTESEQGQKWTNKVQQLMPWFTVGNGKVGGDGIISPGGHITQVAPGDWALAFRNLGDVAGAFQPGGSGGNTANVTISQTFTLNGNVNPRDVREQAYKGTSSAMSEMFSHTARIMQLMPATR